MPGDFHHAETTLTCVVVVVRAPTEAVVRRVLAALEGAEVTGVVLGEETRHT